MMGILVDVDSPLTPDSLHELYTVEWSEADSNRRMAEEDTIYAFEAFLESCTGNVD